MKGPFGLVIAAGMALLIVAILFSLAPMVGGSIDNGNPIVDDVVTMTLLNDTAVTSGHHNIGGVDVSNSSTFATTLRQDTDFSYTGSTGYITLLAVNPNYNGTYYVRMDYSRWSGTVNTDMTEGGDWFADNTTWVTLCFLGIVAGIIIAMFMRW